MGHDIIIIGAGPAGLSFAAEMAGSGLDILVVEKTPMANISEAEPDGREIALTHLSVEILQSLGAWSRIPEPAITPIRHARVVDGTSDYSLDFDLPRTSTDALGYMVPNYRIRQALYDTVAGLDNVSILPGVSVEQIVVGADAATVLLSNGDRRKARLVVAADSRFSDTRRKMGLPAKMKDFSRVAIVCRMEHEKPHDFTATECFHYGRTLAVLPLQDNTASIVITVPSHTANDIINMDQEEFNRDIQQRFGNRLGWMKLVGERYAYPLVAVHADRFVTSRYALIGDASVGMHPVTAHGFNLGLRGQHTLAREVLSALAHGKDIGSLEVLKKYERTHMRYTRVMYEGTNGIVGVFTNDSRPMKLVRSLALRVANRLPPIKYLITRSLTEKSGFGLPGH